MVSTLFVVSSCPDVLSFYKYCVQSKYMLVDKYSQCSLQHDVTYPRMNDECWKRTDSELTRKSLIQHC